MQTTENQAKAAQIVTKDKELVAVKKQLKAKTDEDQEKATKVIAKDGELTKVKEQL